MMKILASVLLASLASCTINIQQLWQKPLPYPSMSYSQGSNIDAIDGNIYFTTDLNGTVYAINLNSTEKSFLWQLRWDDINLLLPVPNSDVLLVCLAEGTWAVSKLTGRIMWVNNTYGFSSSNSLRNPAPPVVWTPQGDVIFQNQQDASGSLTALNPLTGAQIWAIPNANSNPRSLTPSMIGCTFQNPNDYSTSYRGIDKTTGQVVWKMDHFGESAIIGVTPNGVIAVNVSNSGPPNYRDERTLFAFEGTTGKKLWQQVNVSVVKDKSLIVMSTLLAVGARNDYLFAYNLNAEGKELWRSEFKNWMKNAETYSLTYFSAELVALSYGSQGMNFTGFNIATGAVEWNIDNAPSNANGVLMPAFSDIVIPNLQGFTVWNSKGELVQKNYHDPVFGAAISAGSLSQWGNEYVATLTQSVAGYTIQNSP